MAYNHKFMDEAKPKEIEELLAGEKGNALIAWSLEYAKSVLRVRDWQLADTGSRGGSPRSM